MALTAMFSTVHAQKAGQFNPTGQALTNENAYEQYKLQYMKEHPELFNTNENSPYKGVPNFQPSGNTEADNARYEADKMAKENSKGITAEEMADFQKNKEAIYNSDPARYEAMVQKINARQADANVQRVSQEEYQSLPASKKAHMDAHPEQYKIEKSNR